MWSMPSVSPLCRAMKRSLKLYIWMAGAFHKMHAQVPAMPGLGQYTATTQATRQMLVRRERAMAGKMG